MYDSNGHEIQIGDQAIATKTINKVTRIYEGEIRGISHYRPQVLMHVVDGGGNHWFDADLTAVQLNDDSYAESGIQ